jgi:hypothetical protein
MKERYLYDWCLNHKLCFDLATLLSHISLSH